MGKRKERKKVQTVAVVASAVTEDAFPVEAAKGFEDIIYPEVPKEEVAVLSHEKFNRSGMDALMEQNTAELPAPAILKVVKSRKKDLNTVSGFLGMARGMFITGATAEEIIKAIQAIYVSKGKSEQYGLDRGKKILGDVRRQCKHLKEKAQQAAQA